MRYFIDVLLVTLFIVLAATAAHAKQSASIYTQEKTQIARENIEQYDWAKKERDVVVNRAAAWLALSDEQLWQLPVEQTVPRAIYVHATAGCPIHGKALIDNYGVYGWKVDPINKPWKVQCPIGGETWPTNDFAGFYKSGKGSGNIFQYANANRSLLYSTDPNRGYGVDDGKGYVASNGTRYDFIAYYAHWGVWQNIGRSWTQALTNLAEAYVFTGNAAYAHKAAILLSRIADLLPAMDTSVWSSQGYKQGDGLSGKGLALGSIWDAALASAIARAYDAIYPALANDAALYSFLQSKANQHGLTRVDNAANYRSHIEQHALVTLLNAIQQRRIRANEGIHQRAYAEAAIALDDPTATPQWLGWLNLPGTPYEGGGHLPNILVDSVNRDGASDEGSPGYNNIWLEALQPLADLLADSPYGGTLAIDKFANFRNLLSFPYWLQLTPDYYPHIGDESLAGNPGLAPGADAGRYAAAFQRYGYPELAQMAYALNGDSAEGLHGGIFDPGADRTAEAVKGIIATRGTLKDQSVMLSGYGLAALKGEAAGKPGALWMYGGAMTKHGHFDRLNLGMFAYGLDLLPDLGYPDFPTVDSPWYWGWQNNTVAHNTVVVDAVRQTATPSGQTMAFHGKGPVQFVEMEGNGVYPQTSMYRRSLLRVQTKSGFYVVDIFRVAGGSDHVYSLHAGPGTTSTSGLSLAPQGGGTYAGSNVGLGSFYDGSCCAVYKGSGFQFLDNVERTTQAPGGFRTTWYVTNHWGAAGAADKVALDVWSLGDAPTEVAFADGHPPTNKPGNPSKLRYMLERRKGAAPMASTFVHVMEPRTGANEVKEIRTVELPDSGDGAARRVALQIVLADGAVDTIVHGLTPAETTVEGITVRGTAGVVRHYGEKTEIALLFDGTKLAAGDTTLVTSPGAWGGKLTAIDTKNPDDVVLVTDTDAPGEEWAGDYVRIDHPGGRDPIYPIQSVERLDGGARIHLGHVNLVRGHANPNNYAEGYLMDAAVGDAFKVVRLDGFTPETEAPISNTTTDSDNRKDALSKLKKALGCASSGGKVPWEIAYTLVALYGIRGRRRRTKD